MDVPPQIIEYAERTVEYVRRALGVKLEFDSDTLPVLDHYLRTVPADQPATLDLVLITAGAYFGELVRRLLGGRWESTAEEASEWRIVLPTGVQFSPAGFVAAAIAQAEVDDFDSGLDAPPRMRPYLAEALARMSDVTEEEFYSLCGRLDTLEHVHEVLVGVAARMLGEREIEGEAGGEVGDDEEAERDPN